LHATSPYARHPPHAASTPEPSQVKKKRKRADAAQLKVLNEVYARTAFPSTEERHKLAEQLNMTQRSVQIW
jgi:homeobox protein YOX1/YHP1